MVNRLINKEVNITYEEALDILLQIPEEQFTTGHYSAGRDCCSLGHLCRVLFGDPIPRVNIDTVNDIIIFKDKIRLLETSPSLSQISLINDNKLDKYNQNTPKQRVLAYLLDVVKDNKGNILLFNYGN